MIRADFLEEVGRHELNRWREIDFQEPEECRDMKYDRRHKEIGLAGSRGKEPVPFN